MVTKKNITHQLLDELSKVSGKNKIISFDKIGNALKRLETHGLPNSRSENYKYFNVEAILKKGFTMLSQPLTPLESKIFSANGFQNALQLVTINGAPQDFLPPALPSLQFKSSSNDDSDSEIYTATASDDKLRDPFADLNTVFSDRGYSLVFRAGMKVEKYIILHHFTASASTSFCNARNFISVEEGAEATLVEIFHPSEGSFFNNLHTSIKLERDSKLNHIVVQNPGDNSCIVSRNLGELGGAARYRNFTFSLGGRALRNNLDVALNDVSAHADLFGVSLATGEGIIDQHTTVHHLSAHCSSSELYKGIASGKSTCVFNGRIYVAKHAQKTDAYQSSKNILVSESASVYAKPELEIYANDVKCSHGTSTGKLDTHALFYLKSRGIGEENARRLLLQAFTRDITSQIGAAEITTYIERAISESLDIFSQ